MAVAVYHFVFCAFFGGGNCYDVSGRTSGGEGNKKMVSEEKRKICLMDTANGGPCNITSVTVFGICDDYPLYDDLVQCLYLWNKNAKPKESFYRVREVGESK